MPPEASPPAPVPLPPWPLGPPSRGRDGRNTAPHPPTGTQIVGKVPDGPGPPWVNHSWHVALAPHPPRGLTVPPHPNGRGHLEAPLRLPGNITGLVESRLVGEGEGTVEGSVPAPWAGLPRGISWEHLDALGAGDPDPPPLPTKVEDAQPPLRRTNTTTVTTRRAARPSWSGAVVSRPGSWRALPGGVYGEMQPCALLLGGLPTWADDPVQAAGRRAPNASCGSPTSPTYGPGSPTPTRVSSLGFWPGGRSPTASQSSTPMPIPDPEGFAEGRVEPERLTGSRGGGRFRNCRTRRCATPRIPMRPYPPLRPEAAYGCRWGAGGVGRRGWRGGWRVPRWQARVTGASREGALSPRRGSARGPGGDGGAEPSSFPVRVLRALNPPGAPGWSRARGSGGKSPPGC